MLDASREMVGSGVGLSVLEVEVLGSCRGVISKVSTNSMLEIFYIRTRVQD